MSILLPLLVLPLAAVIAICLAAIWMVNLLAGHAIGKRHHQLEQIIATGEIPDDWTEIPRLSIRPQHNLEKRRRQYALRKLDEMIRYVRVSPLVADMETRMILLDRLVEVRADWMTRTSIARDIANGH